LLKRLREEPDLWRRHEPYAVTDETDYTIPVHGEARGVMIQASKSAGPDRR